MEDDHLPWKMGGKWVGNNHLSGRNDGENGWEMIINSGGNYHLSGRNGRKWVEMIIYPEEICGKIIIYPGKMGGRRVEMIIYQKHLSGKMLSDQHNECFY